MTRTPQETLRRFLEWVMSTPIPCGRCGRMISGDDLDVYDDDLDCCEACLTPAEISAYLRAAGVPEEMPERTLRLLREGR